MSHLSHSTIPPHSGNIETEINRVRTKLGEIELFSNLGLEYDEVIYAFGKAFRLVKKDKAYTLYGSSTFVPITGKDMYGRVIYSGATDIEQVFKLIRDGTIKL